MPYYIGDLIRGPQYRELSTCPKHSLFLHLNGSPRPPNFETLKPKRSEILNPRPKKGAS